MIIIITSNNTDYHYYNASYDWRLWASFDVHYLI